MRIMTLVITFLIGILGAGLASWSVRGEEGKHHPHNPHGVRELVAPPSWVGQWQFAIASATLAGQVQEREQANAAICPGDTLGLSFFVPRFRKQRHHPWGHSSGPATSCRGAFLNDRLELECESRLTVADCRLAGRLDVKLHRVLDSITGAADWKVVEMSGDCEPFLGNELPGEHIEVSAQRSSEDSPACSAPPASLFEKLFSHPGLISQLPQPVEDLSATAVGGNVRLTWTANREAAAYLIYRAKGNKPFELIARETARRHGHFKDRPCCPRSTFRYFIRSITDDGAASPASNEVSVTFHSDEYKR
jgi:hypothetical protein